MNIIKIILTLILLFCFSPIFLFAEETEKRGVVDEVESAVIDSDIKDPSSNQAQESAPNVSPDSISGELKQSSDIRRDIIFKGGYLYKLLKPWVYFTDRLKKDIGLDIGTTYSILYQHSTKTISTQNENDAASGVLDFFGHWNVFHSEDKKKPWLPGIQD